MASIIARQLVLLWFSIHLVNIDEKANKKNFYQALASAEALYRSK